MTLEELSKMAFWNRFSPLCIKIMVNISASWGRLGSAKGKGKQGREKQWLLIFVLAFVL